VTILLRGIIPFILIDQYFDMEILKTNTFIPERFEMGQAQKVYTLGSYHFVLARFDSGFEGCFAEI
jgi:hypothetical protein